MFGLLFALGRMVGLGTAAGVRPSLTIAVIGIVHHLHAGLALNATFAFLGHWIPILSFVVLAMVDSALDKIPRFDRVQSRLSLPYRVVMGGIAGAATIPYGVVGLAVGAAAGAAAAWFALYTKQLARPRIMPSDAALVLLSLWEDLAGFATAFVTLVFSPFGYLALAFTTTIYWRTRYLRGAKYRKMRRRSGSPEGSAPDTT